MMPRFFMIASLLGFSFFGYAQYQGWNMFDAMQSAGNSYTSGGHGGSGGHAYHK